MTREQKENPAALADQAKHAAAEMLLSGKRYHIITYGCQMNAHDSEKIAGILQGLGMQPATDQDDADLILINTCCVREHAENRVYGNVGALMNLKRQKPGLLIGVCGCMMQQEKAAAKLVSKMRHVDLVFGTHNLHELPELLVNAIESGKTYVRVSQEEGRIVEGLPAVRAESVTAFVTIMYGCDNFCSYCIVPHVRGRERSREHALASARVLNAINPDFIRLRTYIPMPGTPLYAEYRQGAFGLLSPHEALRETKLFIETLATTGLLYSDHHSNYAYVNGRLPEDRVAMLGIIEELLTKPEEDFRPPTVGSL